MESDIHLVEHVLSVRVPGGCTANVYFEACFTDLVILAFDDNPAINDAYKTNILELYDQKRQSPNPPVSHSPTRRTHVSDPAGSRNRKGSTNTFRTDLETRGRRASLV